MARKLVLGVIKMKFIFIYITCASIKEAEIISKHLLKKRLIACANFFPIKSKYWWKGKIVRGKEWVLLLKTVEKNYILIKKEIEKLHSYSVPCITKIKVQPNREYGKWMKREIKS
ncbi:MAG: divalent-cation tolerance protein CutA [Candidatus Woesearchaeota archaeon]